ncbi:MAG: VCBS repeat-containing protein [Candidatus Hydrogenedentes bacterium]|nr:VCBS repeat-containing protein [Candidatus Hydrogenedentota bacterium]
MITAVLMALLAAQPLPAFTKHTVDPAFDGGYQVKTADLNRDGRLDIIALGTTPSQLVWYRAPQWDKFPLDTGLERYIDAAPRDIDGDGDTDLAIASAFDLGNSSEGGLVHWLECPPNPEDGKAWAAHYIDQIPTSHRVRWADWDGDGAPELINLAIIGVGAAAPQYAGGLHFRAYTVPGDPGNTPWPQILIDGTLEMAHGLSAIQWDADPALEILTASFQGVTLFDPGRPKTVIGAGHTGERPKIGSSEVALGSLAGGARYIAAIEPWHGNEVVIYQPHPGGDLPWTRTVIDTTFEDGHALLCADFNGDVDEEIVAGHRGGARSLYVYRFEPATRAWARTPLDTGGMGAAGLDLADLDHDGDLDIIAIGTATKNIAWYENTTPR